MRIFLSLFLVSVLGSSCKNGGTDTIKQWFNDGAENCDLDTLHHCSQWKYLSNEQWTELVMDSIQKLDPPIKDGDSVFDMGVGVGAVLQVIDKNFSNITVGGSDIADKAIAVAKQVFPAQANNFLVHDMAERHDSIAANSQDHVVSFGALAMYLTQPQMISALTEAIRMTKSGGSMIFTSFIEPNGTNRGTIVTPMPKSFWQATLPSMGVKNVKIYGMKNQGDRYQVACTKN